MIDICSDSIIITHLFELGYIGNIYEIEDGMVGDEDLSILHLKHFECGTIAVQ